MAIDLFKIGNFTIHGYGLMIGIGFLVAVLIGCYRCDHGLKLSSDHYSSIAIFTLLFGWMGGKLLYIIVEFKTFIVAPMSVIGSSGFVVYGGIITGVLTIYLYCRIKGLSFLSYLDALVPCVAICQGFGRLGCFMAGCCYGKPTTSHFSVVFPENSLAPANVPLIPTQLYSAGIDFLLAAVMIGFCRKFKRRGDVSVVYFGGYAIGRFIIECFRDDPRGNVGSLSTSQFISIFMLIFAILFYFNNKRLDLETSWKLEAATAAAAATATAETVATETESYTAATEEIKVNEEAAEEVADKSGDTE